MRARMCFALPLPEMHMCGCQQGVDMRGGWSWFWPLCRIPMPKIQHAPLEIRFQFRAADFQVRCISPVLHPRMGFGRGACVLGFTHPPALLILNHECIDIILLRVRRARPLRQSCHLSAHRHHQRGYDANLRPDTLRS